MAKQSLATKYRPKSFDDLTEQGAIKDILNNQISTGTFQHAYLFTGPAGTGKTTSARIFADMINKGKNDTTEIDAASNSGVDNIRVVIDESKKKSLVAEYKIFIIDECHSLSDSAWQAMLKLLEEPPKFSIFILCTTDPQKIPNTILSRVQRFQFNKISTNGIFVRLQKIMYSEFDIYSKRDFEAEEIKSLQYIAKVANGGMRDAITLMDKCLSLSKDLTLDSVLKTLGTESYDTYFGFLDSLTAKSNHSILTVENVFNDGKDVKQFMKDFAKFILDVEKYVIYNSFDYISLPHTDDIENALTPYLDNATKKGRLFEVMDLVVDINNKIKWESDAKTLIELELLLYCGRE